MPRNSFLGARRAPRARARRVPAARQRGDEGGGPGAAADRPAPPRRRPAGAPRRQPGADRGGAGPRPGDARARGGRGRDRAASRGDDGASPGDARAGRIRARARRRRPPGGSQGEFEIDIDLDPELGRRQDELFLAVARELLTNAARHANAERVRVTLARAATRSSSRWSTTGAGWSPGGASTRSREGHIGLASVAQRVQSEGGEFELESSSAGTGPGRGCRSRRLAGGRANRSSLGGAAEVVGSTGAVAGRRSRGRRGAGAGVAARRRRVGSTGAGRGPGASLAGVITVTATSWPSWRRLVVAAGGAAARRRADGRVGGKGSGRLGVGRRRRPPR